MEAFIRLLIFSENSKVFWRKFEKTERGHIDPPWFFPGLINPTYKIDDHTFHSDIDYCWALPGLRYEAIVVHCCEIKAVSAFGIQIRFLS